ncbi:MAG: hypothetical protein QME90_13360 [Thermodesulfobacteriota bacterium]|nr:hypothetical protein [Thermodesulfobacteriota bacterium]
MIENWFILLSKKLKGCSKTFREIMYGMTVHEMDLELKKERGNSDQFFMLIVFGDLVGLPLLPPLLFHEAFTIHHTFHRDMEKELIEGEGPDRFRFDGYLISMRERAWGMN